MKVTKQYLESVGFVQYNSPNDPRYEMSYKIPFYNEDDIHMMEKQFHRNLFVVILTPHNDYEGIDESYLVYVQEDAGCGFVNIPYRWSELHIEHFEALYISIMGHKPGNKKAELIIQDDETVLP